MRFLANIRHAYKLTHLTYHRSNPLSYASVGWDQFHTRLYGSKSSGNSKFFKNRKIGKSSKRYLDKYKFGSKYKRRFSKSSSNISPVAVITNPNEYRKIALIPINLFEGENYDAEAFQEALAILSLLRNNSSQVEQFMDSCSKLKVIERTGAGGGAGRALNERYEEFDPEILSDAEKTPILADFDKDKSTLLVDSKNALKKTYSTRLSNTENAPKRPAVLLKTQFVTSDNTDYDISFGLPKNIANELKQIPVSGMQLNFEMDMTNVKEALLNPNNLKKSPMKAKKLSDSTLALSTNVQMGAKDAKTIPLCFNAMIHGTVDVNPKEFTEEKLKNLKVPEFNEYVTAVAANLCSTALQKGFPTDFSRKTFSKDSQVQAACKRKEREKGKPAKPEKRQLTKEELKQKVITKYDKVKEAPKARELAEEELLSKLLNKYDQFKTELDAIEAEAPTSLTKDVGFNKWLKEASKTTMGICAATALPPKGSGSSARKQSPHIVCVKQGNKGCVSPGLAGNRPYVAKGSKGSTTSSGGSSRPSRKSEPCAKDPEIQRSTVGLLECGLYQKALEEAERNRSCKRKSSSSCGSKKSASKCGSSSSKCGAKKSSSSCGAKKSSSSCGAKKSSSSCGAKKSSCGAKKSSASKCGGGNPCEKKKELESPCPKKKKSSSSCGPKKSSSSCGPKKSSSSCGAKKSKCGAKKSSASKCGGGNPCEKKKELESPCPPKKKKSSSSCGAKKSSSKCGSSSSKCGAKKSSSSKCGGGANKCGGSKSGNSSPCRKASSSSICANLSNLSDSKTHDPCVKLISTSNSSSSKCGGGGGKKRSSSCGGSSPSKCGSKSPKKKSSSSSCGTPKKSGGGSSGCKKACKKSSSSSCGSKKSAKSCGSKGGSSCGKSKKSAGKNPCKKASSSSCGSSGKKGGGSSCGKKSSSSSCGAKKSGSSACGKKEKKKPEVKDPCKKSSSSSCGKKKKSSCGKKSSSTSCGKKSSSTKCGLSSPKPPKPKMKCGRPVGGDTKPKCKGSSAGGKSKDPCKKSSSTSCRSSKSNKSNKSNKSSNSAACTRAEKARATINKAFKMEAKEEEKRQKEAAKCPSYSKKSKPATKCGRPVGGDRRPKCKKSSSDSKCGSSKSSSSCGKRSSSTSSACNPERKASTSSKCGSHGDENESVAFVRKSILNALKTPVWSSLEKRKFSDCKCRKEPPHKPSEWSEDYRLGTCKKFSWKDTRKRRKRVKKPKNCYPEETLAFCPDSACYRIYVKYLKGEKKRKRRRDKENKIGNEKALCTINMLTYSTRPLLMPVSLHVRQMCRFSSTKNGNEEILVEKPYELCKKFRALPRVSDNDVLVKVDSIAVSDTDIHLFETGGTKFPGVTLGHEASGIVEKVGKNVKHLKPCDHVVIESSIPCGNCFLCKAGRYNICNNMVHKGCLRKFCSHPAAFCHKICKEVPLEHGALVYQITLGCNACYRAGIKPNTNVAIIGSCAMSVCAAMCAQSMGAANICVICGMKDTQCLISEHITDKTECFDSFTKEKGIVRMILETLGTFPDVVINCASCTKTMNAAIMALKPAGTCIVSGFHSECVSYNMMDALMKEILIIPSFRSTNMYPNAINLLEYGRIPIDCLIGNCFRWDEMDCAFQAALSEGNCGPRKSIVLCQRDKNVESTK